MLRAFTDFDGLHLVDFSARAQVVLSESAASTNSATRATRAFAVARSVIAPVAPSSTSSRLADRSGKGLWAISSSGRSNEKSWRRTRECYTPRAGLHARGFAFRVPPVTPPHTLAAKGPLYSPPPDPLEARVAELVDAADSDKTT